ncbi:hypothetical protein C8F04DRAFT_141118 [Mycena alexandri]|uniref:Uncharacterized protein n=1 Tax=Mycena alexandri TaxID=1745969 RepID=A0AAD6WTV5_9AGAR|nr:hypothetical protein C8F04DRAFT_141118 [Mycena alexandri]
MSFKFVLAVNMAVVVLESFLYALLLVAASTTLYLRFTRHEIPKLLVWNPVVLFTVLISATSGAHWILTIVRFFDVFVGSADAGRSHLDTQEVQTATGLLTAMVILIGDAVIIHRLWLIWNRSLLAIILPLATCVGGFIIGCAITYLCAHPVAGAQRFLPSTAPWAKAGWFLPLATNVYCTGLITWQIWKTNRTVEHLLGDGTLVPVLIVLLESAAVWTIWVVFFAVAGETGSPLQNIARDLSPTVAGLVNMAIYLRVELQCTRQGSDRTGVAMTSNASIIPYYT